MSKPRKLNERQRKFATLYVTGAAAAGRCYEAAGYTARGRVADKNASRMLKNADVSAYVQELQKKAESETVATLQETLEFLTAIIRTPLSEIEEGSPLCVEYSEIATANGVTRRKKKLDPVKAAQELARLLNWHAPQEVKLGASDEFAEMLAGIAKTGGEQDRM